jgi:catabolite regulation protein CreA
MKKLLVILGLVFMSMVFCSTSVFSEEIGSSKTSGLFLKDTLTVHAQDDPEFKNVVCYTTDVEIGGPNLTNPSSSSISCRLIGPFEGKPSSKRNVFSRSKNPFFKNSSEVFEYYRPLFYGLKKERFLCALLDTKNRVFKENIVSEGTLTSSPVHPREVFRDAIKEAAASVLFVHNHPSGDPSPSRDDINITKRLVETGNVIGIKVLDHLIISDGKYLSLMEKGYMS